MVIGVQSTKKQGCEWIYPLVNVYIAMDNHHFEIGKSTINGGMFNSFVKEGKGKLLAIPHFSLRNRSSYNVGPPR